MLLWPAIRNTAGSVLKSLWIGLDVRLWLRTEESNRNEDFRLREIRIPNQNIFFVEPDENAAKAKGKYRNSSKKGFR